MNRSRLAALALALVLVPALTGCASRTPRPATPPARQSFHLYPFESTFGFTQAIRLGDRILISGSVSMDEQGNTVGKGDMRRQVAQAYGTVQRSLAHFGADFSHVVRETVRTTDMDAFLAVTDERAKFYAGVPFPVASWIGVQRLVSPDYLVEVEVEAALPAAAPSRSR